MSEGGERVSLALERALSEISRVELALVESGDVSTLASFGNPREGSELASRLGYGLVSDSEARVIDQLRWLPDANELIREFLALETPCAPPRSPGSRGRARPRALTGARAPRGRAAR